MTNNKILEKVEHADAAKSFVFPVNLTAEQKKTAAAQLTEKRKQLRSHASPKTILAAKLMQLKFQLEDYLDNKEFQENRRFGNFLNEYLKILNKKRNEFAQEISVHETFISQLINNHRVPNENIVIRLEIHSNDSIPADYWFRLVEKEKIYEIKTNRKLRASEKSNVLKRVPVRI